LVDQGPGHVSRAIEIHYADDGRPRNPCKASPRLSPGPTQAIPTALALTVTIADQVTFTFDTVIAEGSQSLQMISTGLAGNSSRGEVLGGSARAGFAGSPNGSYAFQLTNSPVPALTIGVLSFDGAGKAVMTFKSVDSDPANPVQLSGSLAGTDDIQPDGTGTINLTPSSGRTFAMVVTDGGFGASVDAKGYHRKQRVVRNRPTTIGGGKVASPIGF
jgi:hypothetical protein